MLSSDIDNKRLTVVETVPPQVGKSQEDVDSTSTELANGSAVVKTVDDDEDEDEDDDDGVVAVIVDEEENGEDLEETRKMRATLSVVCPGHDYQPKSTTVPPAERLAVTESRIGDDGGTLSAAALNRSQRDAL